MGCGTACSRILLVLFTAILSVIGCALLTAGLLCKFGSHTILKSFFEKAFEGVTNINDRYRHTDSVETTTNTQPDNDLSLLLEPISTLLIAFGSVIAALSLLGFLGACCRNKCLLQIYAIFEGLTGVALVVLSALVLSGAVNDKLQRGFLKTIENNYYGMEYMDTGSLTWNFIMIEFKCCGLNGYQDFNSSKNWKREKTVNNHTVTLVTPVACCKMNGTFPHVVPSNDQCAINPNDEISNWNKGCWTEVASYASYYKPYIALVIAGILIIEVLVFIWACTVACKMNQVYPD